MVQPFLTTTPPDGLINPDQQFSDSSEPAPVIPDRLDNLVAHGETPAGGRENGPSPAPSSAYATQTTDLAGSHTGQETVVPIDVEIAKHTGPDGGIDSKLAYTLASIYKVRGQYELALKLLNVLESQGADSKWIQNELKIIARLMQANGTDEIPKSSEGSSLSNDNSKNFISVEHPQDQIDTSPNDSEGDGVEIGALTEPYTGYWREENLASESVVETITDSEIELESQFNETAPAPPTKEIVSGQTDTEAIPDHETAEEIIPPFEPVSNVDTDLIGKLKAHSLVPPTNFKADSPEDQLEYASNDNSKEPEKAENGFGLYGQLAFKPAAATTIDTTIKPDSQIEERADEAAQSVPFMDNQA